MHGRNCQHPGGGLRDLFASRLVVERFKLDGERAVDELRGVGHAVVDLANQHVLVAQQLLVVAQRRLLSRSIWLLTSSRSWARIATASVLASLQKKARSESPNSFRRELSTSSTPKASPFVLISTLMALRMP